MKIIFEGRDLYWFLAMQLIYLPCVFYCAAKLADWLADKIIRLIGARFPIKRTVFNVSVDPSVPDNEVRFVDPRTGEVLAKIVNLAEGEK